MFRAILSQTAAAILWLLHFLPLSFLAALGRGLGAVLYRGGDKRRNIVAVNLSLCFPELDEAARTQLAKAHYAALGRSLLERSVFWWGSRGRLERMIRVEGEQIIHQLRAAGKPVILLVPHFVGLDAAGVAISLRFNVVSIYAEQANPVFNRLLLEGRTRFGDQQLLSRQDGARATVKAMKSGRPFFYLPDLNARRRDAVFAPFFGVQTATISGLSRLARAAGAAVVPCVARMLPGSGGYVIEIGEAWSDFPTADVDADTARMNAWIEGAVRTMPEQYYWVHRRFKTRPPGEPNPYGDSHRRPREDA